MSDTEAEPSHANYDQHAREQAASREPPAAAVEETLAAIEQQADRIWLVSGLVLYLAKKHRMTWPATETLLHRMMANGETGLLEHSQIWCARAAAIEWPAFKQRVVDALQEPRTEDELRADLASAWPNDPDALATNLVAALSVLGNARQVEAVQATRSGPVQYQLSQ